MGKKVTHSRLRLLLVAPSPPPYGGMALQARMLERLLRADGNQVEFFASNFALPRLLGAFARLPGVRTVLRASLIWFKLAGALRRAEVVHVYAASWLYFYMVVWPAVLLGRVFRRRVVVNYRGGEAARFFRWNRWLAAPVFRMASVVTAPSCFLAGVIEKEFGVPVQIVSNILDLSVFRYRRRERFGTAFLTTRHLEKIYDIESVLRAFAEVQRVRPEASLWIAGTGSLEQQLRELTGKLGLRDVLFLGRVAHEDLPAICDQRDILLNASLVDNFPGALLEASAAGMVVVSTGAGGIPHIYRDETDALLVAPGDWRGLARASLRVVDNPALAQELSAAGQAVARRCAWREVRAGLYRTYDRSAECDLEQGIRCDAG